MLLLHIRRTLCFYFLPRKLSFGENGHLATTSCCPAVIFEHLQLLSSNQNLALARLNIARTDILGVMLIVMRTGTFKIMQKHRADFHRTIRIMIFLTRSRRQKLVRRANVENNSRSPQLSCLAFAGVIFRLICEDNHHVFWPEDDHLRRRSGSFVLRKSMN